MKRLRSVIVALIVVCMAMAIGVSSALAEYPDKPIQIIVPMSPGGGADIVTRFVASVGTPYFGQPMVVVNKRGGGGSIGMQYVATAAPDGYTLGVATLGRLVIQPLVGELPYSYEDFVPIGQYIVFETLFCVQPDAPWKNLKEFLQDAKAHPNKIKYCTGGVGTQGHIAMESLCQAEGGIQMVHVPFHGTSPCITAVMGGHVPIGYAGIEAAMPLIKAGKLRPLVTLNTSRSKALPEIPCLTELGYTGTDAWASLVAPKGTPQDRVNHLEQALDKTLQDKALLSMFKKFGEEPKFLGSEEIKAKILKDQKFFADMVKKIGIAKKKSK
jgi:tripartite-type tricarboxylate transporter receptor subunit TctC